METSRLSLKDYLNSLVVVDKLSVVGKPDLSDEDFIKTISKALQLSAIINLNSPDELRLLDNFRYDIFRESK